jgi:hypothetical protein
LKGDGGREKERKEGGIYSGAAADWVVAISIPGKGLRLDQKERGLQ